MTILRTIWGFIVANLKIVVPLAISCLLILFLMHSCGADNSAVKGVQQSQHSGGIGWGVLLIAAGLFFVAYRVGTSNSKAAGWLTVVGITLIGLWGVPKFMMAFQTLTGQAFGLLSLLLIALSVMAWRKRGGKIGKWALILVATAWIGSGSGVVVGGLGNFVAGLGFKMPSVQLPAAVGTFVDSLGKDAQNLADRKAASTEQGTVIAQREIAESGFLWLGKDAKLYREVGSANPSEFEERIKTTKVKVLDKTREEKGVKLQLVRFPDAEGGYLNGPEFLVEVTKLMTEQETLGGKKVSGPTASFNGKQLGEQARNAWNWVVGIANTYPIPSGIAGIFLVWFFFFRRKTSGGSSSSMSMSPSKIINGIIMGVIILSCVAGFFWVIGNIGGVDLFDATEKKVVSMINSGNQKNGSVEKKVPIIMENLSQTMDLDSPQGMLCLSFKYNKVELVRPLKVEVVGGTEIYALFGSKNTGKAKVKKRDFGYQEVDGHLKRSLVSYLGPGTLIDFKGGDRLLCFVSSKKGGGKVKYAPEGKEKMIFAYREFKGTL